MALFGNHATKDKYLGNDLFLYGFDSEDAESQSSYNMNLNIFSESDILSPNEQNELSELISTSLEIRNISYKSAQLIFNAKRDGFTHHSFYSKCSNKRNTLIVIQSYPTYENDYVGNKIIFGGFLSKEWRSNKLHVEDKSAFLYRLRANEYGARVFRIKNYEQFAVYQSESPQNVKDDYDNNDHEIFYFGQPTALFLAQNCDKNEYSYCDGGTRSNYDIPFPGSLVGECGSTRFKVINFEVYHFK